VRDLTTFGGSITKIIMYTLIVSVATCTNLVLHDYCPVFKSDVESSWNVMEHGDARVWKWRGNWRIEWVASTLHTISEHGITSITTADTHTSAASGRLNWRSRRFKWTGPFRRKTKSGFCACAITFQTQSTWWCAEWSLTYYSCLSCLALIVWSADPVS
jgi:hypothetical protein